MANQTLLFFFPPAFSTIQSIKTKHEVAFPPSVEVHIFSSKTPKENLLFLLPFSPSGKKRRGAVVPLNSMSTRSDKAGSPLEFACENYPASALEIVLVGVKRAAFLL